MYVLDTNVVAELRKAKAGRADKNATAWAESVAPSSLFLSTITVLELELGVLLIERRDQSQGAVLRTWMDGHVLPAFAGRFWLSTPLSLIDARSSTSPIRNRSGMHSLQRPRWFTA